jgi:hypothetical protein
MPRFIVWRTFSERFDVPLTDQSAATCHRLVETNAAVGVTWVRSYVSDDKRMTYCIYDGPDQESIRVAARRSGLPVDSVILVSVLNPYSIV